MIVVLSEIALPEPMFMPSLLGLSGLPLTVNG